jgi:hypothetical protein
MENILHGMKNSIEPTNEPIENIETRMITQILMTEKIINPSINIEQVHSNNTFNLQLNIVSKETELFTSITKLCKITIQYLASKNNMTISEKCDNMLNTFNLKNKDYGNSYKKFGLIGLIIRLNDKIHRFKTLNCNKQKPNFESIFDTIDDMSIYCCIILNEIKLNNMDVFFNIDEID